ncbi:MAG: hypothetical protein ACC656_13095 [Candidatus Heimdallarchaeota archaeon]
MTTRNKYVAFEKFKFIDDMIEDGNYEVAGKHIRKELKNLKNKEIKLYLGIIQCKIIRLSGQFKVSVKKLKRIKIKF